MMLRESSKNGKDDLALDKITGEDGLGSGVPHGDVLVRLVDATLKADDAVLATAREAVIDALGREGLVDAAGVIGAFTMQNRVADATGLPLDTPMEMATRSLRAELGVDQFSSAAYTNKGGWARAVVARLVEPLLPIFLRVIGRLKKGRKKDLVQ